MHSLIHACVFFPLLSYAVPVQQRDLVGNILSGINAVATSSTVDPITAVLNDLQQVTATTTQTDVYEASRTMSSIWMSSPTPTNIFGAIAEFAAAGLTTQNVETLVDTAEGFIEGANSYNNSNPINPDWNIYPQAWVEDAQYDLSEEQLRSVIYIPDTFQYGAPGAPNPIILVPGTGDTGYGTFLGNYIPLLQGSDIADPVWLNIPINLLSDAQGNAEYVAYAINYISGISNGRMISVGAWSQGNIDTQWAFKYWPSTRERVTDHVAFSPDYHGTVLANLIAAPGEPLPPAVLQQDYNSRFISTMRADGGDSAYVPTTTVYSGFFDEIVEPQQGTGASAYLLDARNVGVTNNEVQTVCAGEIAGTFYTHEGILYNPLGYALLVDALSHDGPGQIERLDLGSVCNSYLSPGLDLADLLLTEAWLATAGYNLLTYPFPVFVEPAIKEQFLIINEELSEYGY